MSNLANKVSDFLRVLLPVTLADPSSPLAQETYRFGTAFRAAVIFATVFHLGMVILFAGLGLTTLAWFNIGSVTAWLVAGILLRKQRLLLSQLMGSLEVTAHAYMSVLTIGWNSGFHYYILILIPVTLFSPQVTGPIKLASCLAIAFIYVALFGLSIPVVPGLDDVSHYFLYANSLSFILVLGMLSYYYSWAAKDSSDKVALLHNQLETLASIDPLTNLLNRREMQHRLNAAVELSKRTARPTALLLMDIDYFKQFNDNHGHDCGDQVLKTLSELLRDQLRANDVAARWGGEEFLLLLADTDSEGAATVAERILARINAYDFEYAGQHMKITITVGVAMYQSEEAIKQTIDRADAALLEGKRSGRNRVVRSTP
ncbi:GGDEF domain-containing protein [uncultured Marinobacter sp.]|uniref:GGDEF domain-containing protein n=1 Tax=uncultured Marinobacter sp. TaxID=187379 RepID=UPI0030D91527